jgi:hypothetical protein
METPTTTTPVPMSLRTQVVVMALSNQEKTATIQTITTKIAVPTRAKIPEVKMASYRLARNATMKGSA